MSYNGTLLTITKLDLFLRTFIENTIENSVTYLGLL